MFKKWFKKKDKQTATPSRPSRAPKAPTVEDLVLSKKVAETMSKSSNPVYAYIAKMALEDAQLYAFLDAMTDVAEFKEEMMVEMIGRELTDEILKRIS